MNTAFYREDNTGLEHDGGDSYTSASKAVEQKQETADSKNLFYITVVIILLVFSALAVWRLTKRRN